MALSVPRISHLSRVNHVNEEPHDLMLPWVRHSLVVEASGKLTPVGPGHHFLVLGVQEKDRSEKPRSVADRQIMMVRCQSQVTVLIGVVKDAISAVRSTLVLSRSRLQSSGMHCAMNAIHAGP